MIHDCLHGVYFESNFVAPVVSSAPGLQVIFFLPFASVNRGKYKDKMCKRCKYANSWVTMHAWLPARTHTHIHACNHTLTAPSPSGELRVRKERKREGTEIREKDVVCCQCVREKSGMSVRLCVIVFSFLCHIKMVSANLNLRMKKSTPIVNSTLLDIFKHPISTQQI